METIWKLSEIPPGPDPWTNLEQRIRRELDRKRTLPSASGPGRWLAPLRAAAMLLVGLGLGVLATHFWPGATPTGHTAILRTPPGVIGHVELPGGIVVQLNSVTTLRYATGVDEVREVHLDGEAYFQVPHDPDREFVVKTPHGSVRDLGTEFNVRAREQEVRVTVTEGIVELEAAGGSVLLRQGEQSVASVSSPPSAPARADLAVAAAWMQGRLVFVGESLGRVAAELERKYGVPFQVDDALRERRISATVRAGSAEDAAEALCLAISAECEAFHDGWSIREP